MGAEGRFGVRGESWPSVRGYGVPGGFPPPITLILLGSVAPVSWD